MAAAEVEAAIYCHEITLTDMMGPYGGSHGTRLPGP